MLSERTGMVRKVDQETRKKAVLAATINRYISKAVPVSSRDIARDFSLSSATIRNIFAELEECGHLTHPYTSGGRIPTHKGYRYYVDFLILQMELLEDEKERITQEYRNQINRIEDLLEKTSGVISAITHYAGIASATDWQDKFFYHGLDFILDQPEFQDLKEFRLLIKAMEDKKRLLNAINRDFSEKVRVYIGEEIDCPETENCSLVVSRYRVKNRPSGRLAVLGPVRMEYEHIIPVLEYISEVLSDTLDKI